jgi:hypothetical protein
VTYRKAGLALLGLLPQPHPDPRPRLVIEETDPRLLKRVLDAHQGRDIAHHRAFLAFDPPDGGNTDLGRRLTGRLSDDALKGLADKTLIRDTLTSRAGFYSLK